MKKLIRVNLFDHLNDVSFIGLKIFFARNLTPDVLSKKVECIYHDFSVQIITIEKKLIQQVKQNDELSENEMATLINIIEEKAHKLPIIKEAP